MRRFSGMRFLRPTPTAAMPLMAFAAALFLADARIATAQNAQVAPTEKTLAEQMSAKTVPVPPIPSGIKAEVGDDGIAVSWKPMNDRSLGFKVLRHSKPITLLNYMEAEEAGVVGADSPRFTDTRSTEGKWYYAVVPYDQTTGAQTCFFVPSENSLVFPVESVAIRANENDILISRFNAILKNQAVILSWEASPENAAIILYRSTVPFADQTSLTRATIIALVTDSSVPYVDYPVPGVPYYYAAVPENVIRSGTAVFTYGENTNEIPAEVPVEYASLEPARKNTARAMPLPLLNIDTAYKAPPRALSPESERIIASLLPRSENGGGANGAGGAATETAPHDTPYRFPEDDVISGGEESALKRILDSDFQNGDWNALYENLSAFMTLRRTPEVSARAHFYLGQARFFMGDYTHALEEFLLAQDVYDNKAREWVQKTLKKL